MTDEKMKHLKGFVKYDFPDGWTCIGCGAEYLKDTTGKFIADNTEGTLCKKCDEKNCDEKNKVIKFIAWLKQCPVDYDEIEQTSDDDIITINFEGKNIYQKTLEKEV